MTAAATLRPLSPPAYDRRRIVPGIVHLGLGGFHRAHMARYVHDLMDREPAAREWGIVAVGLRAADRPLVEALVRQDGLYTLIERDGAGETRTVIGSIVRAIDAAGDTAAVIRACCAASVRILSLTVTEHGYGLDRATRRLDPDHPDIAHDLAAPHRPRSAVGVVAAALAARRAARLPALTVLSCDNIRHNGDVLRDAVLAFAVRCDAGLARWIADRARFPNAMVDRITPQPTAASIGAFRTATGIDDRAPIVAECFRQWVIEDSFVDGRPPLERVGVEFVADVAPYERMKLRLLNASHLALAGRGELAGIATVAETIAHPAVARFIAALMERETAPTLLPVPGVDPVAYRRSVIARFANPAIPDTVARINADAPINYLLDPLRDRLAAGARIDLLALALATWMRRVRGVDDAGRAIEVVHPLSRQLRNLARAGGTDARALLSLTAIFGDLGLSDTLVRTTSKCLAQLEESGALSVLECL